MRISASQKRFLENVVLTAALQLIFTALEQAETPTCLLGQIAETTSGGTPDRQHIAYFGGDIPWIKSGELKDGLIETCEEYITEEGLKNSSAKIYPQGTLVVALYGATVGKTGILAFDAASNQAVCAITPLNAKISAEFLFWFLRYKRPDFLNNSFGGAQPNISQKILRETSLPFLSVDLQEKISNYLKIIELRQKGNKDLFSPSLPEPLSIVSQTVARIEELAAKIEEARELRVQAEGDTHRLLLSEYHRIIKDAKELPMSRIAPLIRRPIDVELEQDYYELGIRSFGKGTFHKSPVTGAELGTKRIFRIEENDLLFNIVFAWEGAVAVAKPEDHGRVGSHRFLTCVPIEGVATSSFLCFHFLTEQSLGRLLLASPGSAGRNRTLGIQALENIMVPLPSYEKQIWFEKLQSQLANASEIGKNIEAELTSMLPSILDKAFKGEL